MAKVKGRPCIFSPKDLTYPDRRAKMTTAGYAALQVAKRRLALIVDWPVESVSDGDTIEFLCRGEAGTRAYLAKRRA